MIIEKPISIPKVARTLGTTENDLGRLCAHANINEWAKFKPIKLAGVDELTEAQYIYNNYGIEIVSDLGENSSPKSLYDKVVNLGYTHKYLRPIGGELSPFRISDFTNYQHDGGLPPISTGVKSSPVKAFRYQPFLYGGVEPQPTEFLLSKLDLYPAAHRGILLVNVTKNASYWTTGAVDWDNVILRTWSGDDIRAMQFIVTNPEERLIRGDYNRFNTISDPQNDFYAVMRGIDSLNPYAIDYTYGAIPPASLIYVSTLSAIYNYSLNKIEYTLIFKSDTPETRGGALKDIRLEYSLNGVVQTIRNIGNDTLPNNSTKTYTGVFTAPAVTGLAVSAFEGGKLINKSNVIIQQ